MLGSKTMELDSLVMSCHNARVWVGCLCVCKGHWNLIPLSQRRVIAIAIVIVIVLVWVGERP